MTLLYRTRLYSHNRVLINCFHYQSLLYTYFGAQSEVQLKLVVQLYSINLNRLQTIPNSLVLAVLCCSFELLSHKAADTKMILRVQTLELSIWTYYPLVILKKEGNMNSDKINRTFFFSVLFLLCWINLLTLLYVNWKHKTTTLFEIPGAVLLVLRMFWNFTPCRLVNIYRWLK